MTEKDMLFYIHETKEKVAPIISDSEKIAHDAVAGFTAHKPERVILVASGTSFNSTLAVRLFFEKMTQLPVSTIPSYNYAHYETVFLPGDIVFAISQEGESTNTLAALEKAQEKGVPVISVTENLRTSQRNTIAQKGDYVLDILCGKEEVGPKTKGYIATVLTLQMAALEIGKATGKVTETEAIDLKEQAQKTVANFPNVIVASLEWFDANERDLAKLEKGVVVGYGSNFANAIEGGLKALETVRYPFSSFEVEEFLHGPLAMIRSDVYTFFVSPKSTGYERINPLYKAMQVQNKHCYSIGTQEGAIKDKRILESDCFKNYEDFTVIEYIIPLQIMAYKMYKAKDQELYIREYPKTSDVLETKTARFRK